MGKTFIESLTSKNAKIWFTNVTPFEWVENYQDQVAEQFNPILQKDELSIRFHVLRSKYQAVKDRYTDFIEKTKNSLQNYCLSCCQNAGDKCESITTKWNPNGECFANFLKFHEPNSLVFKYKGALDKLIEELKEAEEEKKSRLTDKNSALRNMRVVQVKSGPGYVHPGLKSKSSCQKKSSVRRLKGLSNLNQRKDRRNKFNLSDDVFSLPLKLFSFFF